VLTGFELQEALTRPAEASAGAILPGESWSHLERWIWEKLQAGAIANIDEYADDSGRLPPADPKKPEDWQDGRRRLALGFLEDLLLREPYRSGLHRRGVRIEGAWPTTRSTSRWQSWLVRFGWFAVALRRPLTSNIFGRLCLCLWTVRPSPRSLTSKVLASTQAFLCALAPSSTTWSCAAASLADWST
jgi:hypothetical protein